MLTNKRRISLENLIDSFGGGIRLKAAWGIAAYSIVPPEVIAMHLPNTEETLHNYLRRHFERMSKGYARRLAEQREGSMMESAPDTAATDVSGSSKPLS